MKKILIFLSLVAAGFIIAARVTTPTPQTADPQFSPNATQQQDQIHIQQSPQPLQGHEASHTVQQRAEQLQKENNAIIQQVDDMLRNPQNYTPEDVDRLEQQQRAVESQIHELVQQAPAQEPVQGVYEPTQ